MNEVPVEVVHLALYGLYGLAWEHQVNHHFSTPKKKGCLFQEKPWETETLLKMLLILGTWKVTIEIQQRKSGLMEFTLQLVSWHSDIFLCDLLQTMRIYHEPFFWLHHKSISDPTTLQETWEDPLWWFWNTWNFESILSQQSKEGFGSFLCMWTHVDDSSRKNVGILDCKPPTNKNQS